MENVRGFYRTKTAFSDEEMVDGECQDECQGLLRHSFIRFSYAMFLFTRMHTAHSLVKHRFSARLLEREIEKIAKCHYLVITMFSARLNTANNLAMYVYVFSTRMHTAQLLVMQRFSARRHPIVMNTTKESFPKHSNQATAFRIVHQFGAVSITPIRLLLTKPTDAHNTHE